ncbi:hypothetical protein G3I01_16810 [Gramella sp. MT6]|uniref:hypothetical protein n=1 Tax=Gramella sp. MT6 TaxID=2705471 RepID=UPI001C603B8F|nr:hypothetical protein [Gramella sp. MT6]QYA27085.1 hypothetical protein G3I01_16810 [Gramella sp. MT6]
MHRRKKLFVDKVEEISFCGNQMFQFTGGEYEIPFSIQPTDCAHNFENCESCRENHELLMKEIRPLTDKFPFCCEQHAKLTEFPDFNIEDYKNLDKEIADKVYFTHHHIIDRIDNEDWYEDITDYIAYVTESIGTLPPQYGGSFQLGSYFLYVLELIRTVENSITSDEISKKEIKIRIEKIKAFINSFRKDNPENKNPDLNLLLSTYHKWYKIFPFELTYFNNIRERYRTNIPILAEPFHLNRYSNVKVAKLHTKESLTQSLIDTTKNILSQVNGNSLLKAGLLTDTEKIKYDLIIKKRETELFEMQLIDNSKQSGYIKVLKKWLKGEKKFIDEITPYLKNKSQKNREDKQEITVLKFALYIYYMQAAGKIEYFENHSNGKLAAIEELLEGSKVIDTTAKYFQIAYNKISNHKTNRIANNQISNISFVAKKMLNKYPEARNIALEELKLAQSKNR